MNIYVYIYPYTMSSWNATRKPLKPLNLLSALVGINFSCNLWRVSVSAIAGYGRTSAAHKLDILQMVKINMDMNHIFTPHVGYELLIFHMLIQKTKHSTAGCHKSRSTVILYKVLHHSELSWFITKLTTVYRIYTNSINS